MAVKDHYIGRQIKDYQVTEKIGGGTFGAVYRAEHVRLPRSFAIKILHPHISSDETVVKRFKREAETLAMLQHPNVLQIIDFDWNDDIGYYLVTEFLNGEPLNELLRRKVRCTLDETLLLFSQLLSGLAQAHDKGVVHRDLKPANLMVLLNEEQLTLKILDFGIATLGDQMEMTQTGTALGSAKYMSPEQVKGEIRAIDHRSDLYSAGIILGKMLTGRDIFTASSPPEIFWKHVFEAPPPLSKLYPEGSFSPELEAVYQQSIAKEKDHRFQSARQFLEALERSLASRRSTTTEGSVARAFNPYLTGQPAVYAGQAEPSLDPRTGYPLPTSQSFSGSIPGNPRYPGTTGTGAQPAFNPYSTPPAGVPPAGVSGTSARPAFVPHAQPTAGYPPIGLSATGARPAFSTQSPSPYGTPASGVPPMGLSSTGARPAFVAPATISPSPPRPSFTGLPAIGAAPPPAALPIAAPSQKTSDATQSDLDTIRPPDWMLQSYIDDLKAKQGAKKDSLKEDKTSLALELEEDDDRTSMENDLGKKLPSKAAELPSSASGPLTASGVIRPFSPTASGSFLAAPPTPSAPISPSSAILPSLNRLRSTGSFSIDQNGGPESPLSIASQILPGSAPEPSYKPRKMDLGLLEKELSKNEKTKPKDEASEKQASASSQPPRSQMVLGVAAFCFFLLVLGGLYLVFFREVAPPTPPPAKRAQWLSGTPPISPSPPPERRPSESKELPASYVCLPSLQAQAFQATEATSRLLPLPDPTLVLTFAPATSLHVLQRADGQLRQTVALPAKATAIALSKTASLVAVGLATGSILLLDLSTFALKLELQGHTQAIRSIAFSPDGKRVATASSEAEIKIWLTTEDKPKQISKPQTSGYRHLLWGSDPRSLFFSLDQDKRLFLWDLERDLLSTKDNEHPITSLALHPHEKIVAAGLADGSIKLWDMALGRISRHIPKAHEQAIRHLAFHPSGLLLASASSQPQIAFWQTASGDFVKQLKIEREKLYSFSFFDDGDTFLTTSEGKQSSFWTCSCEDGQRRPCYAAAEGCRATPQGFQCLGNCKAGNQVCLQGRWSSCQGQITPLQEVCNGKDDDCDGKADEDKDCSEEPSERLEEENQAPDDRKTEANEPRKAPTPRLRTKRTPPKSRPKAPEVREEPTQER